jgi:hypothetical protein
MSQRIQRHCCYRTRFKETLHDFDRDIRGEGCPCQVANCAICLDLNIANFLLYGGVDIESEWPDLVGSAREGCETCAVLEDGLLRWYHGLYTHDSSYPESLSQGRICLSARPKSTLEVRFGPCSKGEWVDLEFYTLPGRCSLKYIV